MNEFPPVLQIVIFNDHHRLSRINDTNTAKTIRVGFQHIHSTHSPIRCGPTITYWQKTTSKIDSTYSESKDSTEMRTINRTLPESNTSTNMESVTALLIQPISSQSLTEYGITLPCWQVPAPAKRETLHIESYFNHNQSLIPTQTNIYSLAQSRSLPSTSIQSRSLPLNLYHSHYPCHVILTHSHLTPYGLTHSHSFLFSQTHNYTFAHTHTHSSYPPPLTPTTTPTNSNSFSSNLSNIGINYSIMQRTLVKERKDHRNNRHNDDSRIYLIAQTNWKVIRVTNSSYNRFTIETLKQSSNLNTHFSLVRQIKNTHGTKTPTISGPLHMHIIRHYQAPKNLFLKLQTYHNTCKLSSIQTLTTNLQNNVFKLIQTLIVYRDKYQKTLRYSLGSPARIRLHIFLICNLLFLSIQILLQISISKYTTTKKSLYSLVQFIGQTIKRNLILIKKNIYVS